MYKINDRIVSLVFHNPPEIIPGTKGTIITSMKGNLYAVQLPNGRLHRWFAEFELEPLDEKGLIIGADVELNTTHGHPAFLLTGMVVRIIKIIENTVYYDLNIDDVGYHRWLADFEITDIRNLKNA